VADSFFAGANTVQTFHDIVRGSNRLKSLSDCERIGHVMAD
jgi:hypothetical protein